MPPELDPEVIDSEEFKTAVASAVKVATDAASVETQTSLTNLEANNRKLLDEKQAEIESRKAIEEKYKGIDLDVYQAAQERLKEVDNDETRQLLAAGEYEKVFEKREAQSKAEAESRVETERAKTEAAIAERDQERVLNQELAASLVFNVRDGGISQAFVASGADKAQLRSVKAIAKDSVMVKDEEFPVVFIDKDGTSVFRHSTTGEILQNSTGDFSYRDWLVHLSEKEGLPLYAKPTSHSNPNAISDANPKGLVKSKMTSEQKRKFKDENGIPAFDALPYS